MRVAGGVVNRHGLLEVRRGLLVQPGPHPHLPRPVEQRRPAEAVVRQLRGLGEVALRLARRTQ